MKGRTLLCLTSALALIHCRPGCTGLYRKTQAQLPPDPEVEAGLRVAETLQAEKAVQRAGSELLADLQHDKSASIIEVGFDRLEAAAFDFERRALAAADAAKRSGDAAKFAVEIERLSGKARSWLEYVRLNRTLACSRQLENLRALHDSH